MTEIFKFGGASVQDAEAVKNLAEILRIVRPDRLVIVVSAMGKTTQKLEDLGELALRGNDFSDQLDQLKRFHQEVIGQLELPDQLLQEDYLELEFSLSHPQEEDEATLDSVRSYGEIFSTKIVREYLNGLFGATWLDVRKLIRTDSRFGDASIDWGMTAQRVQLAFEDLVTESIVVTQGYIGADMDGVTTTLGKEGSDFTAAILANCLDAKKVTVWKDVPGILNADPKIMDTKMQYEELSYDEITEMTYYGAKVIHPKTMKPLAQKGIPLYVRSFKDVDTPGTIIHSQDLKVTVPTFIFKFNQDLITLRVKDHGMMNDKALGEVFSVLDSEGVNVNIMQNSALTFTFCCDASRGKLEQLLEKFGHKMKVTYNEGIHLATIKHFDENSIELLPEVGEIILEQKSRSVYQRLYVPKQIV